MDVDRRKADLQLQRLYNISLAEAERLLEIQGGHCGLCPAEKAGGAGAFHVDHDHVTGKVRGMLCARCNRQLGVFEQLLPRLESILRYLGAGRMHTALQGRPSRSAKRGSVVQRGDRWQAQVVCQGKRKTLGTFPTQSDAQTAIEVWFVLPVPERLVLKLP